MAASPPGRSQRSGGGGRAAEARKRHFVSCAWAAEVYSANTVGYTRVAVNGLSLLGSQFVEVGTEAALDINEVVLPAADLPGMDMDTGSFQTTLQMWDGSSYTTYGLLGVGQGEEWVSAKVKKWVFPNGMGNGSLLQWIILLTLRFLQDKASGFRPPEPARLR